MSVSPISLQPPMQQLAPAQMNSVSRNADPDGDGDVDGVRSKPMLPTGQGQLVDIDA